MAKHKIISIGLDLSLTHSGYAVIKESNLAECGGNVLCSGVIKSKPSGDKPIDELERIISIREEIIKKLDLSSIHKPGIKLIALIEGLAFMAHNTTALVQLSALNYFMRERLMSMGIPFIIVAPTTLKKFITGSGKGDKDKMMMEVYKNYGFEATDNNECDGYALAVCGLALLGKSSIKLNKSQIEVINLLKKQQL